MKKTLILVCVGVLCMAAGSKTVLTQFYQSPAEDWQPHLNHEDLDVVQAYNHLLVVHDLTALNQKLTALDKRLSALEPNDANDIVKNDA